MILRIYILLLFSFFVTHSCFGMHSAEKRLKYGRDWMYQPILINGVEVLKSSNASGGSQIIYDRYRAIQQVLNLYQKPFKVLDLGANNGFFGFKIAEDYEAMCVLVDGTERLTDICILNTDYNKVIHLKKMFNKNDIAMLSQREHFDVVLALLVLHHVDDWKAWAEALFKLADNVIIEFPNVDDPINQTEQTKQLARFLISLPSGVTIGSFPRGNSYDRMIWFCQNSNFQSPSKLGIDPSTFTLFNGSFPSKSYVDEVGKKIQRDYGNRKWLLQGIDYLLE